MMSKVQAELELTVSSLKGCNKPHRFLVLCATRLSIFTVALTHALGSIGRSIVHERLLSTTITFYTFRRYLIHPAKAFMNPADPRHRTNGAFTAITTTL